MSAGRVLIYGGRGALGSKCVSHFKKNNWWVASVATNENPDADLNIVVDKNESSTFQERKVLEVMEKSLNNDKLDAIFCVAGGWAGGNVKKDLMKTCEEMWQQSVVTSVISASIAGKFLREGGVLTFTGAQSALEATPNMIGYGLSKSAVHFLTKCLSNEKSGLPKNITTIAILPGTLDTPMNRKWMPKGDFSSWTNLDYVADLFLRWSLGKDLQESGSLIKLETKNFNTDLIVVENI